MNMKLSFIRSSGPVLLALGLAAAPADAQEGGAAAAGPSAETHPAASLDSLPTYASADGHVYLTRDEALTEIFSGEVTVRAERWTLSKEQVRRIEEESRVEVPGRRPVVYRVSGRDGGLLGWAMILEERGKYRPITMMVGVSPDFTVRGVEVMVYREDRGEEVRYDRFLRQYRDRGTGDPIRTHRDIMNVTGATISVHSMNDGVRRALSTVETLYGGDGRRAGAAGSGGGSGSGGSPRAGGTAPPGGEGGGPEQPTILARWRPGGSP